MVEGECCDDGVGPVVFWDFLEGKFGLPDNFIDGGSISLSRVDGCGVGEGLCAECGVLVVGGFAEQGEGFVEVVEVEVCDAFCDLEGAGVASSLIDCVLRALE